MDVLILNMIFRPLLKWLVACSPIYSNRKQLGLPSKMGSDYSAKVKASYYISKIDLTSCSMAEVLCTCVAWAVYINVHLIASAYVIYKTTEVDPDVRPRCASRSYGYVAPVGQR